MPPQATPSSSPDLFGLDDPEFLEALNNAVLPGDAAYNAVAPKASAKRQRAPSPVACHVTSQAEIHDDTYAASKFGGIGDYMRRKRAKLQIQNVELDGDNLKISGRGIFHGVSIFINSWTEPSLQELRKLIMENGGTYHAYLDQKSMVTHVITCSLTPAKIREFQHMKVVTPAWLTDSAKAGVLLPWKNYIFKPNERFEDAQGRKAPQKSLQGFMSAPVAHHGINAKTAQHPASSTTARPPVQGPSSISPSKPRSRSHEKQIPQKSPRGFASTSAREASSSAREGTTTIHPSSSPDLFGPDDPAFLEALSHAVLPGDRAYDAKADAPVPSSKRPRSPSPVRAGDVVSQVGVPDDTYAASNLGDYLGGLGDYQRRKRAKLQIQNAELGEEDVKVSGRGIFHGVSVFINSWTEPSLQELRKLIVENRGTYHAYLDRKSLVTHVITCSLTPAKVREFQHMKVVTPEWVTDSVKAGVLLPWKDYIFKAGERFEGAQGRHAPQRPLEGFAQGSGSDGGGVTTGGTTTNAESLSDVTHSIAGASSSTSPAKPRRIVERRDAANFVASSSTTHVLPQASSSSTSPSKQRPGNISKPPASASTTRHFARPASSTSPSQPGAPPDIADALYTTDPLTRADAARVPGYAAHASNPHAARALRSDEWRAANTSAAGAGFIGGYYANSRLHHLSTWKAELRALVAEAGERAEGVVVGEPGGVGGSEWTEGGGDVHEGGSGGGGVAGVDAGVTMRGAALPLRSPLKGNGKGKGKAREQDNLRSERVIMHCDFDCFFVSVGLLDRPSLRGKPVVVCHSQGAQASGSSTSEVASSSYEARKFGVKNGMSLEQARKLCPNVVTIPYEFEKYKKISLQFYTILMSCSDDLQAVSVDEALIDVSSSVDDAAMADDASDPALEFAEFIRTKVRHATGCEVSIGIAHNITLARLATRRAKPAGAYHLLPANVPAFLAPLHVDDLHGFGRSAREKAREKLGTAVLGELAGKSRAVLCEALGRALGEALFNALRGVDERRLESDKPRKSVSCEINYGIRFRNNDEAEKFVYELAEEVARRLDSIHVCGQSMTLKVMKRSEDAPIEPAKFLGHGICDVFNKQVSLSTPTGRATSDAGVIGELAWRALKSFSFDPAELRGIGMQIQKLELVGAASVGQASGQARLPFTATKAEGSSSACMSSQQPLIVVHPSSQDDDTGDGRNGRDATAPHIDIPSFSQVDKSVLEELPDDVRKELEDEYERRRSASRSASPLPTTNLPLPLPPRPGSRRPRLNVSHITRQLAPRGRSSISPRKSRLFARRGPTRPVEVSEEELHKLDIDPLVFVMLPVDVQREQLAGARFAKKFGMAELAGPRKVIKPAKLRVHPSRRFIPPPRPKARFLPAPTLKQQGRAPGEKLSFTEADDVQQVIGKWVERFAGRGKGPQAGDVEFFARFLVRCVDGSAVPDTGVERAVAVMKWWRVLLRRRWASLESSSVSEVAGDAVGKAWWDAYWGVKCKMDVVVRKKFGGSLSIR